MSPAEVDGIARAVASALGVLQTRVEALGAELAEVRTERAALFEQLAAVQRATADEAAVQRARSVEADHRHELVQRDLEALRATAGDPVAAFSRDADGAVSLIQRNGPPRAVPLPDVGALVRTAVDAVAENLRGELQAQVARTFELFCNAPPWSATAVYAEGQIVQNHIGRTYRVRAGIRATIGREPGEDAEHWERLGTGGFRVFKSKPAALEPGDVFTERDARFLHDGQNTILFVPVAAKHSDIERAVKGPAGLAQTAQAQARDVAAQLPPVVEAITRNTQAANDAAEMSIQALAQVEALRTALDALQRRLAAIDGLPPTGAAA